MFIVSDGFIFIFISSLCLRIQVFGRCFGSGAKEIIYVVGMGTPFTADYRCREFTGTNEFIKKVRRYVAVFTYLSYGPKYFRTLRRHIPLDMILRPDPDDCVDARNRLIPPPGNSGSAASMARQSASNR